MGMYAIFKVMVGIPYEGVREELEEIFKKQNLDPEYVIDFFMGNDFLDGYFNEGELLLGKELYSQDWDDGLKEMQEIPAYLDDENYYLLMKSIDNLESDDMDLTQLKEELKIMMDCARVYSFCHYR